MSNVSRSPVVAANAVQGPIVDPNTGFLTRVWLIWFTALAKAVNAGLGTDGTALKMPYPEIEALGGVQSSAAVPSQWINQINVFGVPQLSQPTVADIAGMGTGATTATAATGGAATALPAAPEGYLVLNINGTLHKVPFYAM